MVVDLLLAMQLGVPVVQPLLLLEMLSHHIKVAMEEVVLGTMMAAVVVAGLHFSMLKVEMEAALLLKLEELVVMGRVMEVEVVITTEALHLNLALDRAVEEAEDPMITAFPNQVPKDE